MSLRALLAAGVVSLVAASAALAGNVAVISQQGGINAASTAQRGYNNSSLTFQRGGINAATTSQWGRNNGAGISQSGSINSGSIRQNMP